MKYNIIKICIGLSALGVSISGMAYDDAFIQKCQAYINNYTLDAAGAANFQKDLKQNPNRIPDLKKVADECLRANACSFIASPSALCAQQLATQTFQLTLAEEDAKNHLDYSGSDQDSIGSFHADHSDQEKQMPPPKQSPPTLELTPAPQSKNTNDQNTINWF